MNTQSLNTQPCASRPLSFEPAGQPSPAHLQLVERLLRQLRHGSLQVRYPDGRVAHYGESSAKLHATLELHNWKLFTAAIKHGDIGFAETFIAGDWQTDTLPALIELMTRNRAAVERLIYGTWWGNCIYRLKHLLNRNTRGGSRKNIHAHYDIGNAFYTLWLDPSMTYSSALYTEAAGGDLQAAQAEKYCRILDQLALPEGGHVLEIGCGWGGFAQMAARRGKRVTGVTLSTEQLDFAQARLQREGLAARTDLRLCDYRDLDGAAEHGGYDAIASIEMFEAVGEAYWPSYFACVARNLKQGGRACIQTITIDDALFERYRRGTDFIQQYIFPGG
ncbi:MAG TPA: cyclopropane-fatty-acyl-phospholipid synthase family protein, partial [Burkholderiaceae bacterium]